MYTKKYTGIVTAPKGMIIRDRPGPDSAGALQVRKVAAGTVLDGWSIVRVAEVEYLAVIPINPLKPEYVRIAERDQSIIYVQVEDFISDSDKIAKALNAIATAIAER